MQRKLRIWSRLSCSDNRKPVLSFAEGSAIQKRPRRPKWLGLSVIACVLVVAGAVVQAQQPNKVPRIGYLSDSNPARESARSKAIGLALRELGYIKGKNITTECFMS
jgi:hypothetical protein